MSENRVTMQGFVRSDGTLELDNKLPALLAGRVSVTLEPLPYSRETDPFFRMLEDIWAARERTGLPPRSREEVDADLARIRDEFDEGVEALGELQEEYRRPREASTDQEQKSS